MTALAAARNVPKWGPGEVLLSSFDVPLKATPTVIYQGGIVCLDTTGYGVPASAAVGLTVCGIFSSERSAQPSLTGGATDGAVIARVIAGTRPFVNSDSIAQVDVGKVAFLVDDQTVAKADGSGARSPAGIITKVDSDGVHVFMSLQLSRMLLAASNVSTEGAVERNVTSGALSVVKRSSTLAVTATVAYTLADGVRLNQRKTLHAETAASSPHGVVTPAHPVGFSSLDFTTARGGAELEWNGAGWVIVDISGTVTVTP